MINATPVRPLTSASPSGLPTPAASTPVPPANTPPTPPPATGGMKPVPKKKFSMKMIIGLIVFMVVAVGAAAGFYLTQMNQDVRQQASVTSCTSISGQTCELGACGFGQVAGSGVCGQSGQVCCKPGGQTLTNTCQGEGRQCQGDAGSLNCASGFVPDISKTCGQPGLRVCCKPQPSPTPGATNCPTGSFAEGGFCRCINGDRMLVQPNGSCVATRCPSGATAITSGSNIGKCKCSESTSDGSVVNPNGTCPARATQSCTQVGGSCRMGGCGDGFVGLSTGTCSVAGENCCKAATKCSDYGGANKCNSTTDSLTCSWNSTTNTCTVQAAQTCSQVGGSCVIGACAGGQTPNSAVCGQSGYVCCMGGTGGTTNTCTSQGGTCTIGTQCGAGQTSVSGTSGCGAGICCKPQPVGEFCKSQGGTCTIGTQCGAGQSAVPGTGGTCGAGICCKPSTGGGGGGTVTGALCPNPPNLPAVKYLRFTCPNGCTKGSDGAFHCYENREDFTTNPGGLKNATDCGQVDVLSGTSDTSYCGYTVNTCLESRCQKQPTTSPTPTATPIGAMCLNISMTVNGVAATSTTKPKIGDSVVFTCGQVQRAARYRIRVIEPGGTRVNLNSTNRVSQPYGIKVAGAFKAECSVCMGEANSTCTDWPTRDN